MYSYSLKDLDAATLGRPATVVRNRRDVANRLYLDAHRLQRTNRRLTTRPWPLHSHVDRAKTIGLGGVACAHRSLRRGKRRPLPGTLEADASCARPRDHVALGVGDGDLRVVERGVDVHVTVMHHTLLAALLERLPRLLLSALGFLVRCCAFSLCHMFSLRQSSSSRWHPCAGPSACARSRACARH